jgi:hypothetical protein
MYMYIYICKYISGGTLSNQCQWLYDLGVEGVGVKVVGVKGIGVKVVGVKVVGVKGIGVKVVSLEGLFPISANGFIICI